MLRAPVVVKVPDTLGNVEKSYTPVMVTGAGVEADTDGSEPMVKKAVTHSAIATEIILLCFIFNFLFVVLAFFGSSLRSSFLAVFIVWFFTDDYLPFTKGFRRACCTKS